MPRGAHMTLGVVFALLSVAGLTANAQNLGSLKNISVPQPSEVNRYVKDSTLLTALGKALFWDMQTGSDGRTACATCHFHAGADHRAQNQLANTESPSNLSLNGAKRGVPTSAHAGDPPRRSTA